MGLLYSQGLQDDRGDGEGVFSAALGRGIRAVLYMDVTALVAKTKGGMKPLIMTEKYTYMRFCRKFWMRLNHKKSKVIHYRTAFWAVGGRGLQLRIQGMRLGGVGLSSPVPRPLTLASGGGNHALCPDYLCAFSDLPNKYHIPRFHSIIIQFEFVSTLLCMRHCEIL